MSDGGVDSSKIKVGNMMIWILMVLEMRSSGRVPTLSLDLFEKLHASSRTPIFGKCTPCAKGSQKP